MKTLTQLKEIGIYVIEVPKDILGEIQVGKFLSKNIIRYVRAGQPSNIVFYSEDLPEGNWQILGTITPDNISFDPASYLESQKSNVHIVTAYKNYTTDGWTWSKNESFYTLLNSCGYYWVNPLGADICTHGDNNNYCENFCQGSCWQKEGVDFAEWQSFEDNLLTGLLLALIKK